MAGQPVRSTLSYVDESYKNGATNIPIAGTAVPLSAISAACNEILIQARRTNVGRIYIGGLGITNADNGGVMLQPVADPGQPGSIQISAQNLNQIYLNASVGGDGVTFIYW